MLHNLASRGHIVVLQGRWFFTARGFLSHPHSRNYGAVDAVVNVACTVRNAWAPELVAGSLVEDKSSRPVSLFMACMFRSMLSHLSHGACLTRDAFSAAAVVANCCFDLFACTEDSFDSRKVLNEPAS